VTPRRCIEIHDSVLSQISFIQNEAQLHFSALYIHESDGVPGIDSGRGWFQHAILRIHDAKVDGVFAEFPVKLTDGRTQIGQEILENKIPVPLHHQGAFELRLQAMWQDTRIVTIKGKGAELQLLGEPKYIEEFRC
jgi:hypothetical protein